VTDAYRFIAAEKANYPISLMSRVLGVSRVHAELRMAHGVRVSRKRVERLMREAGISGLAPKRKAAPRSGCPA
jgi:transposase InsO family protein